jgi:hypothetical protein
MHAIDVLRSEIDRLESHIEDLEEKQHDTNAKLGAAEAAAAGTRLLSEAVRLYFSWVESPPKDMDPDAYERLRKNFRQDVEMALRAVEG